MFSAVSKPEPVDLDHSCISLVDPVKEKDDVPIILLHGLFATREFWKDIDKDLALKTGKRVFIPDLRNHGDSPYTEEYDVETMTKDLIHLLDKLKISKAIFLGHSLGGKIAVHLALNYPTRIEKIIVEDSRSNGVSPYASEYVISYCRCLEDVDNIIAKGFSAKETKEMIIKLLNDEYNMTNTLKMKEIADLIPIKLLDGKYQWKINPKLISVSKDLRRIFNESTGCFDGPSLFIYGAKSSLNVKEDVNNIKRLFPNAHIFEVKSGGHVLHAYPEFTETVIQFINKKF